MYFDHAPKHMIRLSVDYRQDSKIPIRLWKSLVGDTPSLLHVVFNIKHSLIFRLFRNPDGCFFNCVESFPWDSAPEFSWSDLAGLGGLVHLLIGPCLKAGGGVVSASDVTPTDHWLNVWCIWYTYLECRSHRRIGWIIQDFRETCVSRSLTFRLETKMPWRQTPSRKKKAVVFTTVTTSAYQDQLNAGFSKVCEIFNVRGIESLKYVREFYTPACYCGDISTHRNVTLNERNCDWLFDMSVKRPHGWALANKCCHLFQTFSLQSEGLATRD